MTSVSNLFTLSTVCLHSTCYSFRVLFVNLFNTSSPSSITLNSNQCYIHLVYSPFCLTSIIPQTLSHTLAPHRASYTTLSSVHLILLYGFANLGSLNRGHSNDLSTLLASPRCPSPILTLLHSPSIFIPALTRDLNLPAIALWSEKQVAMSAEIEPNGKRSRLAFAGEGVAK
jgi:hypothetical protein